MSALLITRREAAAYLGYNLRHFERHVQPHVGCVGKGRGWRTTRFELDRWSQSTMPAAQARCTCAEWRRDLIGAYERQLRARFPDRGVGLEATPMAGPVAEWSTMCRLWCPRTRTDLMVNSSVYFLRIDDAGPVKIGTARVVEHRRATLQTAHAGRVTVFSQTRGTVAFEKTLHTFFAKARIRGEWFRPTRALLAIAYELDDRQGRRTADECIAFGMRVDAERAAA